MTSVRKRPCPPIPRGRVTPSQAVPGLWSSPGVGRDRRCIEVAGCCLSHDGEVRRASGPGLIAQRALLDQHLQAVDRRDPPLACRALEVRAVCPVDKVHHARELVQIIGFYGQRLETGYLWTGRITEADRRAVDEQVGLAHFAEPRRPELLGQRLGPFRGAVPE